jgi:hypothetical protein
MEPRGRISLLVLPEHKRAAERLAEREGESVSVLVRRLIVAEAKRRGLWGAVMAQGETITEVEKR